MDREDVLRFVEDNDVKFIRMQFTDISGIMKNIAVTDSEIEKAFDGVTFDGSAIEGFTRVEESDMRLVPELDTLALIPWRPQQGKVARFICEVILPDGSPFEGDPRYILKKVVNKAANLGYTFNVAPECEFFLFHTDDDGLPTTKTHDTASYFDLAPIDLGENARREACLLLEDMGYQVVASHHEVAAGQHEIDLKYDDALKIADTLVNFKMIVKITAQKHGLHATFMPKPFANEAGSGMHLNMSLVKDGVNVFRDDSDPVGLSKLAYNFIGGIFAHIKGITALTNPLVNSYKRLNAGFEAPPYITWARRNRSPLIRIPTASDNDVMLELRSPDSSCNPYLALAVLLAAGLEGIEKNIMAPPELTTNVYQMTQEQLKELNIQKLPENLGQALDAFESDELIHETLGDHAFYSYLNVKRAEWSEFSKEVHDWELKRYLSTF